MLKTPIDKLKRYNMRWERFDDEWIDKRFFSGNGNVFIIEIIESGACLYWFDDGFEIPTESIYLDNEKAVEMEKAIAEMSGLGEPSVCDYLSRFFPELRKYWIDKYGGI
jgi:hypothetical protein